MTHDLKVRRAFFVEVAEGRCHHDIRKETDRSFRVGDQLFIREWDSETKTYTGRAIEAEVSFVSRGPELDLPEGMVVLSIELRSEVLDGVFPAAQSDPAVTQELLAIAAVNVPMERVEAWTPEERQAADEWASNVVLHELDSAPPMPAHVERDRT